MNALSEIEWIKGTLDDLEPGTRSKFESILEHEPFSTQVDLEVESIEIKRFANVSDS